MSRGFCRADDLAEALQGGGLEHVGLHHGLEGPLQRIGVLDHRGQEGDELGVAHQLGGPQQGTHALVDVDAPLCQVGDHPVDGVDVARVARWVGFRTEQLVFTRRSATAKASSEASMLGLLLALSSPAHAGDLDFSKLDLVALDGTKASDDAWADKVVLFVNVASKCGYTPQYEGLQELHEAYADKGLVVVGVPSNQFGGQEPGTAEEIASFCKLNYGVTFPLLEKQDVNGEERSALYQELVASKAGGGADVAWNFEKFLVGRDGAVLARFSSKVTPGSEELKKAIEGALAKER